jgi:hypothetical protein
MKIKRFKQSQKFRVIVGPASFYATAKQIRYGVGGLTTCNDAVQKALDALEYSRAEGRVLGISGTWSGLPVQLDVAS